MDSLPSRRVMLRLIVAVLGLWVISACGSSSGCAGCATTKIPGGFPTKNVDKNGVQLRVTDTGLSFLQSNLDGLIGSMLPGGLAFDIPATGCSGTGSLKLCCNTTTKCQAAASISTATLTPKATDKINVNIKASVWTGTNVSSKKVVTSIPVGVTFAGINIDCNMSFDSTKGSKTSVNIVTSLAMSVATTAPEKLALKASGTDLKDLEAQDITISGSNALCPAFHTFLQTPGVFTQFESMIKSSLVKPIEDSINSQLSTQDLGQEGRLDLSGALSSFSPSTTGELDFYVWPGGYAEAMESPKDVGLSMGMLSGFMAAKHNACVPDCEATGASCSPPVKSAITRSKVFETNKDPSGNTYHLGVGVHRQTLNVAGYAAHRSGALCLDVGTDVSAMVSSSLFEILLPSLKTLTGGVNSPLKLSLRPQKPPVITLGAGTYTTSGGKPVITEPLLKVKLPSLDIAFYVLVDERMINVFTISGDLEIPLLLYADSKGKLVPVLGDLSSAMTNMKVSNNELVTEPTTKITSLIPTLLGLIPSLVGDSLAGFDLPAFQGMQLKLGPGAITSVDKDTSGAYQYMAIFATLAKSTTTTPSPSPIFPSPEPGPAAMVETKADLASMHYPRGEAFARAFADAPGAPPTAVVNVDALVPSELAGKTVEYSYRLDGGFYSPFARTSRLVVEHPALWVPGRHRLEVRARVAEEPSSIDETPAELFLVVDPEAPGVKLVRTEDGVRAEITDRVARAEDLSLCWSVDGAAFGPFGVERHLRVPDGARVMVKVRDGAGNETLSVADRVGSLVPDEIEPQTGGCAVGAAEAPFSLGSWVLLALLVVVARRRRV